MSEPIRVLILDTVMDRGGAEAMIMNYYRNFDRAKVQYDFLVHRQYKAAYEDEITSLGGKIYRICPVYPQYFARYKREIRKFFKEHPEYNIIHCNTMELGYFACKEARRQGIPVIICHSHNTPKGFDLKTIFRTYFKIRIRKYVTHMFACSRDAGIWLFGKKNKDIMQVINNAIDSKTYAFNESTREKIRKEFNICDKYVVGHVGRFFQQKNHEFLIDIFHEVHKKNKNSLLMIVGGGETDNKLKNKIRNKVKSLGLEKDVIFTGVRSDVNELMQAFDVFLFPSLYEGFGIVLIEAQVTGLHCITSDDVVPKEVCITDLVEYISLSESAISWADAVLKYQNGYQRTNRQKEIIEAKFDIADNAIKLQEFYFSTLKN